MFWHQGLRYSFFHFVKKLPILPLAKSNDLDARNFMILGKSTQSSGGVVILGLRSIGVGRFGSFFDYVEKCLTSVELGLRPETVENLSRVRGSVDLGFAEN